MEIDQRFDVSAPLERVWALLRDPHVVAACFPGAELTEQVDDETFAGRITVAFGPTKASFSGLAKIVIDDQRHVGEIEARGRDARGASSASAKARVQASAAGDSSVVEVAGTIDVGGPLGGFAASGGARITEVLFQEFGHAVAARAATADDGQVPTAAASASRSISGAGVLVRAVWASVKRLADRLARRRGDRRQGTSHGA